MTHTHTQPRSQYKNIRQKSTQTIGNGDPLTNLTAPAGEAGDSWDSLQGLRYWW